MKNLLYTDFASEYGKAIQKNLYNAHFERPSLQAMFPDLRNISVLDLGCASGEHSQYLLEHGANVTAIDISHEMIDLMRRRFEDSLMCYVQDLSIGLPEEDDKTFDLVICPLTIHYIENLKPLFTDIGRVLKKNGLFIFSTHHPILDFQASVSGDYFENEFVTQKWDVIGTPVEVSFYRRSLTSLFTLIKNAGLCVVDMNEGAPLEKMRQLDPKRYKYLSTKPQFLFLKCMKF